MYNLSTTSNARLNTCHSYLQAVVREAIKVSPVDFGVAQGERTKAKQLEYFLAGKSKVDPRRYTEEELVHKGKHITTESFPMSGAVDIYAFVNGKASWDIKYLSVIYGVIMAIDKSHRSLLRCGINWDSDGTIITDQNFLDAPHYELINRVS